MPNPGIATAYDLTVGTILDMDEAIFMASPMDSPFITGVGSDGLSVISSRPTDQISFEWMGDALLTPRSTLAAALTTGTTFVTVASGDRTKFSTGDVAYFDKATSEHVRITGYGVTTDTLLVTRAYAGTATDVATSVAFLGLGTALAEGSDPEDARVRDRTTASNYTQIFGPTKIHMSATEQVIRKYGVPSEWSRQAYHRTVENVIAREQAYLYGVKSNSTTTRIRTTGGLAYFLTSNNDTTVTQFNVTNIQSVLQDTYNAGGVPDRVSVNPASLADLNDITNTSIVRTDMVESRRGRQPVTSVITEFGVVTIVRNRWQLTRDAFFFNRDGVIRRILRPLQLERLAKTGDSDKAQIVCEEGLEVKGVEHMARMTALSYT